MNCKKVKEQINRLFDRLEIKDSIVLAHIKTCKKCKNEYNAILKIINTIDTKEKIKIPYNFNKRVWNKIGEPQPFVFDFMDRILIPKPVFVTAVILVLFLFGVYSIIKNNFFHVKTYDFVYNINNKDINDKQATVVAKEPIEKHEIKISEINKEIEEIEQKVVLPETEQKQVIKKVESKKEEITYNTFVSQVEDIKTGSTAGEKIAVAEVKKEPDKIETVDTRYLREDFKILNNVFNPAKGEKIIIRYKIQNQYKVKIIIYDRNGELVRILIDENKNTGVYETTWDGKDAKNNIVSAGIYFIYLKTDIVEKKIKTLVVK